MRSSRMAASTIVYPTFVFSFLRSMRVRTEMPIEVTESITPRNSNWTRESPNIRPTRQPRQKGTSTPPRAAETEGKADPANRSILISAPLMKRSAIMPRSAKMLMVLSKSTSPNSDGPRITPAGISPIIEEMPSLSHNSPRALATARMRRSPMMISKLWIPMCGK